MAKYINPLTINKLDSGKRFYNTVVPETPTLSEFPREYTARVGDRWDNVAFRFYGKASLWYKLAIANGGANGSIFIKPGTVIKIPEV